MSQKQDVVIIGAGMVGACLALALAAQGRSVAVVDREPAPEFVPGSDYGLRVSAINRASQQQFEQLRVWQAMLEMRAHPYRAMQVWDAGSSGAIEFDAASIGEPDLGHIIENQVVQRALWEAMQADAQVTVLCPDELRYLDVGAQAVHVGLVSGARLSARLVVGADGAQSRLRELASIGVESRYYGQKATVATVKTQLPHEDTAWQRFLSTGPVAFLPLGDGSCSIVWSADDARAEEIRDMSDEEFKAALAEALDYRLGAVEQTSMRGIFPLRGSQADAYVKPRIALVGDAAHTIHPLAGQGANLGFQDAAALAAILAEEPRRDPGDLRLLRRYERARRGENVLMMRAMEGFRTVFGSEQPGLASLRGLGLNTASNFAPLKHFFTRQALGLGSTLK
ncbi:2-octaprenyl-6-methoxyphenol hydroxylase /2-octaprenyl-3-methyl-6-methoxy-1,4-benzoquinol hydroxylase [Ectothiorhodosinus mongolicus]|uniref:2-octaprenyl-6-methoxyphenol hydroxylase /2-octaprenyl-3-methyl-6-methoxy-1,4-benzoquinol hydroxylase n=1 Tax=Ectothiorhodosinus mongolicus TaxID=233100 RepID=A0A1R3W4W3_9GAMM|nr:UbiH/UbiF/VisC/COQ6 family ubiquinone biosynthesis hydroxylase [Ectothiorhodosinus mongolicus]ULX57422.1 2-octaprenyl-3-methyl-6-methoxy-1,4-benzoquinol hydroxylase [Ectothiorhodosinus mongolicus]SIT72107.1 2-octaprenyl-6-methoxyphenol hydroxylase /2-octaprenyl-3-methyl-6-methoxy-1,4-benzoquinol hydroxylase [Ectothiorhodosinus mongolicus]